MNEVEFKKLCAACDGLLKEKNIRESRISISWLHILKFHPNFLKNYNYLFLNKGSTKTGELIEMIKHNAVSFIRIVKGIWQNDFFFSKDSDNVKSDMLIISHIENKNLVLNDSDFYFGRIPSMLSDYGIKSTIALINYTGLKQNELTSVWKDSKHNRIIINNSISFFDELKIYLNQLIEFVSLRKLRAHDRVTKRVIRSAAIHALSSTTANNLRLKKHVSKIIKITKPSYIMVTYEGHAWERLLFAEARKINPKIQCIGYQHALINFQHAVYRSIGPEYDPNIIATSGEIDLEKFNKYVHNSKINKINIGTSKKIFSQNAVNKKVLNNNLVCLVLFDGIKEEFLKMVTFINELVNYYPQVQFIYRFHPRFNKKFLVKEGLNIKKKNLILSSSNLKNDFEKSHLALYRGSNAIYGAASYDVLPVFIDNGEGNYMDPLSDISNLRINLNKIQNFQEIISLRDSQNYRGQLEAILNYCFKKNSDLEISTLIQTIQCK